MVAGSVSNSKSGTSAALGRALDMITLHCVENMYDMLCSALGPVATAVYSVVMLQNVSSIRLKIG